MKFHKYDDDDDDDDGDDNNDDDDDGDVIWPKSQMGRHCEHKSNYSWHQLILRLLRLMTGALTNLITIMCFYYRCSNRDCLCGVTYFTVEDSIYFVSVL